MQVEQTVMTLEDFKEKIIARSNQITTCFFIDESEEYQFEEYFNDFNEGVELDDIIFKAVKEAYPE